MNQSKKFAVVWSIAFILSCLLVFGYKIERSLPKLVDSLAKISSDFSGVKKSSAPESKKASRSLNWAPYMKSLEANIKKNWNPPKAKESKRVVTIFKISKDGELLSLKIKESSGDKEADDAAIRAIKESAPFKPLIKGFTGQSVDIEFTFDYNVLNNSKKE